MRVPAGRVPLDGVRRMARSLVDGAAGEGGAIPRSHQGGVGAVEARVPRDAVGGEALCQGEVGRGRLLHRPGVGEGQVGIEAEGEAETEAEAEA